MHLEPRALVGCARPRPTHRGRRRPGSAASRTARRRAVGRGTDLRRGRAAPAGGPTSGRGGDRTRCAKRCGTGRRTAVDRPDDRRRHRRPPGRCEGVSRVTRCGGYRLADEGRHTAGNPFSRRLAGSAAGTSSSIGNASRRSVGAGRHGSASSAAAPAVRARASPGSDRPTAAPPAGGSSTGIASRRPSPRSPSQDRFCEARSAASCRRTHATRQRPDAPRRGSTTGSHAGHRVHPTARTSTRVRPPGSRSRR